MALWKLMRPILNITGATKKLQKLFEKTVAENQAAGLSANSAYNAAKREVMETLKKIKVTKKAEGGEVQKLLAGGLLNPLIRVGLKTKGYKSFAKQVNKYVKTLVKTHKKDPVIAKLENKRLKIDAIRASLDRSRKEMSKNLFVRKHYFGASSQARGYQKKLKDITKAYMHKKANPKIQTHSEGGEIVFGKNVDKDLL